MRYGSCLGKVLLLLCLCLLHETGAQRQNFSLHRDCPSGTSCRARSACRPSVISSMREPPKACGFTYSGQERICCPVRPNPLTPTRPTTQETPVVTHVETTNRPQGCGKVKGFEGYVMRGKPAEQGDFPWMVAFSIRDRYGKINHICTGAMITSRHVLSAAHCFHRREPTLYLAKIGNVDRKIADDYGISRIEVPDTYKRGRFFDDIAVVTLSSDVSSNVASPICLPESSEFLNLVGKGMTAAGWGFTHHRQKEPSTNLMALSGIPIVSNEQCNSMFLLKLLSFRRDFPRGISDGFICAGFLDGKRGTCKGDGGGPLMHMLKEQWYVIGINSFGVGGDPCFADPNFPEGFTRVSEYLDWIQQKIKS